MKKEAVGYSSKFTIQAHKTVSMAFALCESKMKAAKGGMTPELKVMCTAMLSMERAIETFIAAERLFK